MPGPQAVDFGTGVSNAWSNIATAIPKVVLAAVILLVAWLVAKALAKIVNTVLERVGFDRAVERGGLREVLARSSYDASDVIAKIVYYAVLLIGLSMAFGVFGSNPISDYLRAVVAYLPKVFVAIVIVVIAAAIAKALRDLVSGVLGGLSYGNAVATAASLLVLVIGVFAALDELQIAQRIVGTTYTAFLVMIVGIAVVGVGGGLIRPMQQRWESWLGRAEEESSRVRQEVAAGGGRRAAAAETETAYPTGETYGRESPAEPGDEQPAGYPAPGSGAAYGEERPQRS